MNAIEFINEARRMCFSHHGYCKNGEECQAMYETRCLVDIFANELDPVEAVRIVEEWSKAHPVQTNADKFKEVFGSTGLLYEMFDFNSKGYGVHHSKWWDKPYEAPKGTDN